jgi:hypothetical protein
MLSIEIENTEVQVKENKQFREYFTVPASVLSLLLLTASILHSIQPAKFALSPILSHLWFGAVGWRSLTQTSNSRFFTMQNFEFRGSNKRCAKSDRVLLPGEEFYSALVEKGEEVERLDFAADCWDGPPENCIGWWKTQLDPPDKQRVFWAPREVLLAYFDQVRQHAEQADCAYITALLLAQKKILTTKETLDEPDATVLRLENKREGVHYEIPIVEIAPQRLQEIQDELTEKLFTSQAEQAQQAEPGDE